ncbi:MAG: 30S ribosomal protein S21 [Bdellovibrionales bacterium]|nr:30S ribosomal protein S21 [Bdellovibrionales bacterium]
MLRRSTLWQRPAQRERGKFLFVFTDALWYIIALRTENNRRPRFIWKGVITIVQVIVRDNNVDQALRALKKKMQREGLFREMKVRRHYEKPSVKKAREKSEAVRRYRKLERKRKERDGE